MSDTTANGAAAAGNPKTYSRGYIRYAMWLLLIIYIFNFLDRQIMNILAADIKAELKINDTQFGMLAGLAFALLYTFMGIPIARLAERKNRPVIMGTSLFVWSGFTALCGTAQNFWQLALYRVGVGVGEAGGTPPAHSLIVDYHPKEKRASALAFYSMGVPLGTLAGLVFGGMIADSYGWRAAFFVAGVPGIIIALITFFTLKETRSKVAADIAARAAATPKSSIWTVLKVLIFNKPTFLLIAFAAALKSFIGYGQASFHPLFFFSTHGEAVTTAAAAWGMGDRTYVGLVIGLISGIFGAASSLAGGWIADKMGAKDVRNTMVAPALAVLVSVPVYIAAIMVDNMYLAFALMIIPYFLNYFWYGPVYATTQGIVPPHMRATAAAILLFIINMLGLGLGPMIVGMFSDLFASMELAKVGLTVDACTQGGAAMKAQCAPGTALGLRYSLAMCSLAGVLSFILFMLARRSIVKDMES